MHDHVGEVIRERQTASVGLAFKRFQCRHDITELARLSRCDATCVRPTASVFECKSQNIGRPVLCAVSAVEGADVSVVSQDHAELDRLAVVDTGDRKRGGSGLTRNGLNVVKPVRPR